MKRKVVMGLTAGKWHFFVTSGTAVDVLIKSLKTKAFIIEKFLDTAFHCPIRFRQKVLMVFFEPPLELFSLERKGRSVAGRPFRFLCRFAPHRLGTFAPR
jgi:hypothetical protein